MGNVNGKERLSASHPGDLSNSDNNSTNHHNNHHHHHHHNNKPRSSDPVGIINTGSSTHGSSGALQSPERPRLGRQRSRTTSGTHSANPFFRLGSKNNNNNSSSNDNISGSCSGNDGHHKQHSQHRKSPSPPISKPKVDPRVLVDGGYLVPQGVYKGEPDYDIEIVRDLQLTRRLAPFFKPLNDYDDSWNDRQLFAAIHGLTLAPTPSSTSTSSVQDFEVGNVADLRKSRNRASTLNGHDTGRQRDQNHSQLMIYRGSQECPICFMFYPPFLNATRCCAQPICSECFVQIKRPDPHAPHNNEGGTIQQSPSSPSVDPASTATSMSSLANDQDFLSEPACCPFCTATDFGIVYSPPIYVNTGVIRAPLPNSSPDLIPPGSNSSLAESSLKSPVSSGSFDTTSSGNGEIRRPRRLSLPPIHDQVVTTDKIRPNWALKLAAARAHAARRSFAASALHSSVFLSSSPDVSSESVSSRFSSSARAFVVGSRQHPHNSHGRLRHKNDRKHRLAVLDQEEAELTEAISQSLLEEEARKLREKYANDPMCSPRSSSSPTRFQQPPLPETPVDSQEETVKGHPATVLSHEGLKSSDSIFSMHHMGTEQRV